MKQYTILNRNKKLSFLCTFNVHFAYHLAYLSRQADFVESVSLPVLLLPAI
jgi:hypothetical protein